MQSENKNSIKNQPVSELQDHVNLLPRKTTIDYIYYVEWRQFTVNNDRSTANCQKDKSFPHSPMQMTHSRALLGDFHHVMDELKTYHDKMAGKPKKRVRFETDEKLYTCIPDVIQGCKINKIDKNYVSRSNTDRNSFSTCSRVPDPEQQERMNYTEKSNVTKWKLNAKHDESKSSLDVTDEELICAPQKNSKLMKLVKMVVAKSKLKKLFLRKSRLESADESSKPSKAVKKTMERSNSYCRHDDADNVILVGDLEIEEVDELNHYEPEEIQHAEQSYV